MRPAADLVLGHPANAGLRRHREPGHQRPGLAALAFPEMVARPYESLGTHPDLVARLWDELGRALPADCRAIFYGGPALIHPESGIVFGFAGGTHTYALRLPEAERLQALRFGARRIMHYPRGPAFDLSHIGTTGCFAAGTRTKDPGVGRPTTTRVAPTEQVAEVPVESPRIEFESIEWQALAPGARHKVVERGGKRIRLVEFTAAFVEREWCSKAHAGYLLEGELQITLPDRRVHLRPGDGFAVRGGGAERHKAQALGTVARLLLVEDV